MMGTTAGASGVTGNTRSSRDSNEQKNQANQMAGYRRIELLIHGRQPWVIPLN